MTSFPKDIYTEPKNVDLVTLRNLGPLTGMAGIWEGRRGIDIKPKAEGAKEQAYVERLELQPIDPQTNGPQLLYGLRYQLLVTKPDQIKTYHEQVGYWLWEPAASLVHHTLTIPRGQVVLATGKAAADASRFEVAARLGDEAIGGISALPFLDYAFRTVAFHIQVTKYDEDCWSYEEDTVLMIRGQEEPFHHRDSNILTRIGNPTPNPLAR
ncbi:MAG TPA: FABP family protein [Rhodospirillaceae bacterium]|nr:FABP family protein [Rhodospirillaceae bacterium]